MTFIIKRILNHESVDFTRILLYDRLANKDDNRMELVNRNGFSYWTLVTDREIAVAIISFSKWDQAFRVFSKISTTQFMHKAGELLQYSEVFPLWKF